MNYKGYRGFLSGDPDRRLDTYERRRESLNQHSNWGNTTATPYVSFTSSWKEIYDPEHERMKQLDTRQKRSPITNGKTFSKVSFVNANVRRRMGLPMIQMLDNLIYYKAGKHSGDPEEFDKRNSFKFEWLLLFRVSTPEVFGTWCTNCIKASKDLEYFWKDVIVPAWENHEEASLRGEVLGDAGCCCEEHS